MPSVSNSYTLTDSRITGVELAQEVKRILQDNRELMFLTKLASRLNIQVQLRELTASDLTFYAQQNILRKKGSNTFTQNRFDDHFVNIFPFMAAEDSFEMNVQGDEQMIRQFKFEIKKRFEIGNLKINYVNQSPDTSRSNSSIDLISKKISSPLIESAENNLIYLTTSDHSISDAIHLIAMASRYGYSFSEPAFDFIKTTIASLPLMTALEAKSIYNANVLAKMEQEALEIFTRARSLESTYRQLKELDPENRLRFVGATYSIFSGKQPLESKPIGTGTGKTAAEHKLTEVTHQTFLPAYTTMTSTREGTINAYISRQKNVNNSNGDFPGELARRGNGFYTMWGADNQFDNEHGQYKINYNVNPNAREGTDFFLFNSEVIFLNAAALEISPSMYSEKLDPISYFQLFTSNTPNRLEKSLQYRAKWRSMMELAANPMARPSIDAMALKYILKEDFKYISDEFLIEYLNLPVVSDESKKVVDTMAAYMHKAFKSRGGGNFSNIVRVWSNTNAAERYPELIKEYLDHPVFNNEIYLSDNFSPLIGTKVIKQTWLLDYIINSKYFSKMETMIHGNLIGRELRKDLNERLNSIQQSKLSCHSIFNN